MRRISAATWLVIAAAVLAINDHILKGSAFPSALSGKLSDIAGLIAAPPLAALMLRAAGVSARSAAAWGTAAVGVVFAALQLSVRFSAIYDGAIAWLTQGIGLTNVASVADSADLLALPALIIGYGLALRLNVTRNWATRLSLCASALACGGTSVSSGRVPDHWGFIHRDGTTSVQGFPGGSVVARMGAQSIEGSFEVGLVLRSERTSLRFDPGDVSAELAGQRYTPPPACRGTGALGAAPGEPIRARVCFLIDMAKLAHERPAHEGVLRVLLRADEHLELVSFPLAYRERDYFYRDWMDRFR